MAFPSIQDLLESGVHFGHQTRRWNPKMKRFIFAERNGIHIIDLKKTLNNLKQAADKVRDIATGGGNILFVGTKKQLKDIIRDEAERCGMYYVNERWLGGMMTNFQTIKKNIRRLRELERMRDEGEFEFRTKKEALSLERELEKLKKTLDGIKMLGDIPSAMYVVDAQKEKIAVAEANKLGIPLIALIDTNADPEKVNYPIAGNDDAIRSVKVITEAIADAVLDGKTEFEQHAAREAEQQQQEQKAAPRSEEQGRRPRPRRRQRKKKPVEQVPAAKSSGGEEKKQARSASASKASSGKATEKSSSAKAQEKSPARSGDKKSAAKESAAAPAGAEEKKASSQKKASSGEAGSKKPASEKKDSSGAKSAKSEGATKKASSGKSSGKKKDEGEKSASAGKEKE